MDYIITMLPNSQSVNLVYNEFPNIIDIVNKNCLMIDCSTIMPETAKEINQIAKNKNKIFVDAPVSGGILGAQNATLTFMVGSENESIFKKSEEILKSMGPNIFDCKIPSGGQIAKTCNNMALAIQMCSVAEAFNLGIKLGLNKHILKDIMSVSSSRCWSVDTYNPVPGVLKNVPSSNNYNNGFKTDLMIKDIKIALKSSKQVKAKMEISEKVLKVYEDLSNKNLGNKDFGVIFDNIYNSKNNK